LFAWLTARLPILWPLFPFIGLPWKLTVRPGVKPSSSQVSSVADEQQAVVATADLPSAPNGDQSSASAPNGDQSSVQNSAEQSVPEVDESKDAT
jgi:hypothetical protein